MKNPDLKQTEIQEQLRSALEGNKHERSAMLMSAFFNAFIRK